MFPLPAIQGYNRLPGIMTLAFVKVTPGASVAGVAARVAYDQPQLTTIRTASQFGRADQNLVHLQAAVNGSTVPAILIGAVIVSNTMLLSLFERTREFGLLRAIGWTRRRTVSLLLGESLLLAVLGAAIGVGLSFAVAAGLSQLPALKGILHPNFTEGAFWRALFTALVFRQSSRVASVNVWPSHEPWPTNPRSSSRMSPPEVSTPCRRFDFWSCSIAWDPPE
jgi:putative ABC transport system permease protein